LLKVRDLIHPLGKNGTIDGMNCLNKKHSKVYKQFIRKCWEGFH